MKDDWIEMGLSFVKIPVYPVQLLSTKRGFRTKILCQSTLLGKNLTCPQFTALRRCNDTPLKTINRVQASQANIFKESDSPELGRQGRITFASRRTRNETSLMVADRPHLKM